MIVWTVRPSDSTTSFVGIRHLALRVGQDNVDIDSYQQYNAERQGTSRSSGKRGCE